MNPNRHDKHEDKTMPKMSQMFPSKWLTAADLEDQEKTFTVADVSQELIGQGDDAEHKWVVYFKETEKGLVLNKTNATSMKSCFGDDTDDWMGRRVVLYPTEVQFSGKMVEAIRVKEKATRGANKSAPVAGSGRAAPAASQAQDEAEIPF